MILRLLEQKLIMPPKDGGDSDQDDADSEEDRERATYRDILATQMEIRVVSQGESQCQEILLT